MRRPVERALLMPPTIRRELILDHGRVMIECPSRTSTTSSSKFALLWWAAFGTTRFHSLSLRGQCAASSNLLFAEAFPSCRSHANRAQSHVGKQASARTGAAGVNA
jgi:hypothetical protein